MVVGTWWVCLTELVVSIRTDLKSTSKKCMLNLYSFQILYSLSSFQSIGITVTIQFSWEANTSVCSCTADNMVTSVFHVLLPPEVICDYCQPQDYHCCPSNYSLRILVWYFGSSSGCFVLFMFCLLIVYIFCWFDHKASVYFPFIYL